MAKDIYGTKVWIERRKDMDKYGRAITGAAISVCKRMQFGDDSRRVKNLVGDCTDVVVFLSNKFGDEIKYMVDHGMKPYAERKNSRKDWSRGNIHVIVRRG